ncbi:MAG: hypothetical protein AAGC66_12190 [Leifsonia sp.]
MSDTSGLPNTDAKGVPAEDQPERFEEGQGADPGASGDSGERDAQAAEPAETDAGQSGDVSAPGETGVAPEGAEDVTTADTEPAQAPPADFDPADDPSNPDLVSGTDAGEPPD